MAVAYVGSTPKAETSQVSSTTISHTVGGGSNFLVVAFGLHDTSSKPTGLSVTWNTTETMTVDPVMTGIQDSIANHQWTWVYYLANPTTGAHTVNISWTNNARMTGFAIDFSGASSIGTSTYQNTGLTTDRAVTSSSITSNDLILGHSLVTDFESTMVWNNGGTERGTEQSDSNQQTTGIATYTASGTVSVTLTTADSHGCLAAIPILAPVGNTFHVLKGKGIRIY